MPISDTDQHTPFINIVADGVTSIDTFNTWRKKTNGIIKVINDGLITRYIADRAITPSKLSEGGPYWDLDGTFNTNGNNARVGFGRGDTINLYIGHSRSTVGASSLIFRTAATGGIGTDTASITRNSGLTGDLTIYNKSSPIKLSVDASQKIFFIVNGSEIANVSNTGINVVNAVTAKNVSLNDAIPYYRLQSSASGALTWNIESNSGSLYVRSGATTAAANSVAPIRVLNNNTVALGGKLNDVIVSTDELTVFGDSLFTGEIRNNTSITAGYKISSGETSVKVGAERTADGISSLQLYSTKYGPGNTTPSANITRAAGVNSNLTIKNTGSGQTVFEQDDNGSYSFKIGASERLNIDKAGKITIAGTLKVVGGFTTDTPITGANISNRLINAFGDGYDESINIAAGVQNTTTVTLTVQDHGFQIGETVTISELKKGDGTATSYANGEKTITAVTTDTFSYAVGTPASAPFSFDVSMATLSSIAVSQSYFKLGTAVPEDYYLIVGGNRSAADQTGIVLRSQSGNWKPTADSNQYDTSGLHIYKGSGINGNAGIENSGTGTFTLANKESGNIIFSTAVRGTTYSRLTINGVTGAVGIGTDPTTTAALTVSGNIGATRFVGPLTGAVTGKADTAGTADTSLVLETPNIKIDADSIKSNGTLKLNTTKKNGTSADTALDTAVYDGKSGLIATFKGDTKALETAGDVIIASTKKLTIQETNAANRRARAQIGSWYVGQSSLSDGTSDFYIHNGDGASITTPRLKIDGSTGLITGRITNADVAVNLSSTLPIDKGGTGATTKVAALSALGGAPLASPTFTGTPKAPEPGVNSNDTQIATTAFVLSKVTAEVTAANAPTKTGGGASGTWPISIEYNAATATTASGVTSGSIVPLNISTANNTWNFKNKVGVNVASPSFQFEVTDTSASRSVGIGQSEIKFRGDGLTHWSIYGSRTNKDYFDIQNTSSGVNPNTDGTSCFRITKTGNIGLGVSNPTRRLEVDGSVVATEFLGRATSVTNGVYTVGDQTIAGTKTFSSTIAGSINGNAATATSVTNGVYTVGAQVINGVKTFNDTITGSISGNAGSVTNGVYTTGAQVINGVKTFTDVIRLDDAGIMFNSDGGKDTGFTWASDGIFNVRCNAVNVGTFRSTGWNGPVVGTVTGNVTGSSGSCTGNAATATNATNATNAGYATTAGYANNYPNRFFMPNGTMWTVNESAFYGNSRANYMTGNDGYVDIQLTNLNGAGFLWGGTCYAIQVEIFTFAGAWVGSIEMYPTGNDTGRTRILSNLNTGTYANEYPGGPTWLIYIRDLYSGKTKHPLSTPLFIHGKSAQNVSTF
jgi:hypothetical protein